MSRRARFPTGFDMCRTRSPCNVSRDSRFPAVHHACRRTAATPDASPRVAVTRFERRNRPCHGPAGRDAAVAHLKRTARRVARVPAKVAAHRLPVFGADRDPTKTPFRHARPLGGHGNRVLRSHGRALARRTPRPATGRPPETGMKPLRSTLRRLERGR